MKQVCNLFYKQFIALMAAGAVLISIIIFFRDDAAALSKNQAELAALKQMNIEERFDRVEQNILIIRSNQEIMNKSLSKITDIIEDNNRIILNRK